MSDDKTFRYILERAENIERYSDALRENMAAISMAMPRVGITIVDKEKLLSGIDYDFYLAYGNQGIFFAGRDDGKTVCDIGGDVVQFYSMRDAPRTLLMNAVKRILTFMEYLLENIIKHENSIQWAAEHAESINKVFTNLLQIGIDRIKVGWKVSPRSRRIHYYVISSNDSDVMISLCGTRSDGFISKSVPDEEIGFHLRCRRCQDKLATLEAQREKASESKSEDGGN